MNILPNSDPMFSYPQNIQDLIYLLVGIIEEKRRENGGGQCGDLWTKNGWPALDAREKERRSTD